MARAFQPSEMGGQDFFPARSYPVTAGQTYISGALLTVTNAGALSECGTDPAAATIRGVAANPAFSGPGLGLADTVLALTPPTTASPSNQGQVYEANDNTVFVGQVYSGTTLVTPTQAMVGANYGVTKLADGTWTVDNTKTTTSARVTIDQIDTQLNVVFFRIMAAYIQP